MVQGSRSKSRKNINPRRREEGYVLTQGGNPTQPNPNPLVVRRRSSRRRRHPRPPGNGKTDGEKYHASKSTATRAYPDATTRVSTVPIATPIAIDRAIASSSAKPRGWFVSIDRERRTSAHPWAATRSRGKKGKGFILDRRQRFSPIVVVVVRVFSFSSSPSPASAPG